MKGELQLTHTPTLFSIYSPLLVVHSKKQLFKNPTKDQEQKEGWKEGHEERFLASLEILFHVKIYLTRGI